MCMSKNHIPQSLVIIWRDTKFSHMFSVHCSQQQQTAWLTANQLITVYTAFISNKKMTCSMSYTHNMQSQAVQPGNSM